MNAFQRIKEKYPVLYQKIKSELMAAACDGCPDVRCSDKCKKRMNRCAQVAELQASETILYYFISKEVCESIMSNKSAPVYGDLNPCPLCGEKTTSQKTYKKEFYVHCNLGCGITGPVGKSLDEAVRLWNCLHHLEKKTDGQLEQGSSRVDSDTE